MKTKPNTRIPLYYTKNFHDPVSYQCLIMVDACPGLVPTLSWIYTRNTARPQQITHPQIQYALISYSLFVPSNFVTLHNDNASARNLASSVVRHQCCFHNITLSEQCSRCHCTSVGPCPLYPRFQKYACLCSQCELV